MRPHGGLEITHLDKGLGQSIPQAYEKGTAMEISKYRDTYLIQPSRL